MKVPQVDRERRLFRFTRLADPALEDAFRRRHLQGDKRTAAVTLGFFALAVVLYAVPDWLMLGPGSAFRLMVMGRAAHLALSLVLVTWALRTTSLRWFDLLLLTGVVADGLMQLLAGSTRPRDYYMHVAIDLATVIVVWAIVPVRFWVQVLGNGALTVCQALVFLLFRDPLPVAYRGPVAMAYLLTHGVGAAMAWRFHRVRRREWLAIRRTEQDRAEVAEARDTAERATRAKSTFLASVSHELLTPLSAILGFSDVLRSRPHDPPEAEPLAAIHAAATTLHGLLVDVLDLAVGDATGTPLRPQPTDIGQVLDDVAQLQATRAAARGLTFRVEARPAPRVMVDADRLRQVLLNLASNAIRFTHQGGVTLSLAALERKDSRVDVELRVTDTGEGIPAEEQAAIFEPFRQRRHQNVARYGGTGLGLALSRHLVERMGGRIEVESAVGRGSTFHVHLPGREKATEGDALRAMSWELPASTILVADGQAWTRDLVAAYLARQPVQVIGVEDGEAALEKLNAGDVRVALLDMGLPRLDGAAVAERIRGELADRCPAIVLMGAQPPAGHGCWDEWFRKPFGESAILDVLARLLPGSRKVPVLPTERPAPTPSAVERAWLEAARQLADVPHASRARELADRVGAVARHRRDEALLLWSARVRSAADALDGERLRELLLALGQPRSERAAG